MTIEYKENKGEHTMDYIDLKESHKEMVMHDALSASAEFIKTHGLGEFLHRLGQYSPNPNLVFVTGYALKLEKDND